MIWEWLRFGLCAAFLLCGIGFIFCGIFGVFRFRFVLNRMHASAMCDTLGLSSVIIGLVIASGFGWDSLKLLFVILFFLLTSPISGHLIAKLEYTTDEDLSRYCQMKEEDR